MKLYERIENNNFDEIDRNRAIELIEGGNGHLVYNENYFKLQKENEELKADNSHQWEERCKLTFELEKKDEYIKMLTDERDTLIQERDYYKARYNEFNEAFIKMKS